MSAISDFVQKVNDNDTKISADLQKFSDGFDKLVTAIKGLQDIITALQNSTGGVTPEDQKLIDAAQAASNALVTQADAIVVPEPPVVPVLPVPQSTL